MKNTVLAERRIRQRLKLVGAVLCIFSILLIVMLVCVVQIGKLNLNGQVTKQTGVLTAVFEEGSNVLTLDNDRHYNVVWGEDVNVDFEQYKGAEIALIVSQKTFANANPWILGLVIDGQTVVDCDEILAAKTAEYTEMRTVLIIVTAIVCLATCAVTIWRFNMRPTVERELYHEFAEFVCDRQPSCPERKILNYFVFGFFGLIFAWLIPTLIINADAEDFSDMSPVGLAFAITWLVLGVLGIITIVALRLWINGREKKFYAENLPFDFSDISHIAMRKKVKEQLQQEITKAYADNPDLYPDGGNGYDVLFTEKNAIIKRVQEDGEQFEAPDADEVFGTAEPTTSGAVYSGQTVMTLTYDELNFEAVAHYRNFSRPMTIIVKSRLTRQPDFPEDMENDLHFVLDSNLLETLRKYDVKVENLDYLLQNKDTLMQENCKMWRINRK